MSEDMSHSNQLSDAQRLRSSSLNTDQNLAHKKLVNFILIKTKLILIHCLCFFYHLFICFSISSSIKFLICFIFDFKLMSKKDWKLVYR
jgi:hypothetical protein